LLSTFQCLANSTFATGRRGSSTRHQHEAELEDIIGAFNLIHNKALFKGIHFVAENLDRLPKYGPEEVNVCAVVDRQRVADGQLADISRRVDDLEVAARSPDVFTTDTNHASVAQSLIDLDKKVSDAFAALSARIENTNSTLSAFADQVNKVRGPPVRSLAEADNSMNIVINGVPEHRDPESWRGKVDDILQFLLGRHVDVADLFRVGGRYREGRTRPIIVKLRSIWDHRLILGCRYKLKDYEPNRIFIHPDEPLEVRRKSTLDRLKRKYESEGKAVVISDGTLTVDSVLIFTLENGFINRSNV
jgi:hypothetical protein